MDRWIRNARLSVSLVSLLTASLVAAQPPGVKTDGSRADAETIIQLESAGADALRQAMQTLADRRAAGEQQAITLVFPAGRYELSETLRVELPLIGRGLMLRAAEPGKVTFAGGPSLSPIGRDEASNWRYRLPAGWDRSGVPRMLVINGRSRAAARHPNQGSLRIESAMADRRSGFTAQAGDLPETLDVSNSICDLVFLHDWSSSRLPVASYDPATRQLRTVGPIGCAAPHYAIDHFEKQPRYWLEGHPAFADQPLEWYVDRDRNELVVVGEAGGSTDETAKAPEVVFPKLTSLLTATGTAEQPIEGFSLDGITFSATRFPMPPGGLAGAQATMHEVRDAEGNKSVEGRPFLSAAVRIDYAVACSVQRCRFESLGNSGLWIGRQTASCEVKQCRFDDLGGNGLNLGEDNQRRVEGSVWYQTAPEQVPTDNRVKDCEISRCGVMLPGSVAIWAGLQQRLEVGANHIHDCPYTGISLGWIWNDSPSPARENHVHSNHIEYVMQVLSDGGGIYTLGRQPGSQLHHNLITDVPLNAGRAESNGMFLDEGSAGLTIHHNTFRRIEKSPLRFHRAKENWVRDNRWELADDTPPVRFNNTPEENIEITSNHVLAPQSTIFLIGNSLTWDTVPSKLEGHIEWHVDCGKDLQYIHEHPEDPCVASSVLWPSGLRRSQFDFVSVQPHYGTTLEQDVAIISEWMRLQPRATFVIHSGWARQATRAEEYADREAADAMTHSPAYMQALIGSLKERFPNREIRSTQTTELLQRVADDIASGQAPIDELASLYRDAIHMTRDQGRYLMHNAMRRALDQPLSADGFDTLDPAWKSYADRLIQSQTTAP